MESTHSRRLAMLMAGSETAPAAKPKWYLDLTALSVALVINGYPMSAIFATMIGAGIEDQRASIFVRLAMLAACSLAFARGVVRNQATRIDGMLVVLWIAYVARLLWDWSDPHIEGTDIALLFFSATCVFPAVMISGVQKSWNDQNVARYLLVTGMFVCVGALLLKDSFVAQEYIEYAGRVGFSKLNPITLGHVGCTTVLAVVVVWNDRRDWWRWAGMAGGFLGITVLIYAASRGAIVTLVVCLVLVVVCRKLWSQALAVGTLAVFAIPVLAIFDLEALLRQTGLSKIGTDQSSGERFDVIGIAFQEIGNNWTFGSSYTLPDGLGYPHNIFVEAFMAMGVLGFTLFAALCIRTGIAAARNLGDKNGMLALIFFQFILAGQFSGALYAGWPGFWVTMAVLLAPQARQAQLRAENSRKIGYPSDPVQYRIATRKSF